MSFNDAQRLDKTTNDWEYGIWLGRCTQSDEHYVATKDNVYRTRAIQRIPRPERYNTELLKTMEATPWATRGVGKQPTTDFVLAEHMGQASQNTMKEDEDKKETKTGEAHS